jgi:hypothetical protein
MTMTELNLEQFNALNLVLTDSKQKEVDNTFALIKAITVFTDAVPVFLLDIYEGYTSFERCEVKLISFPLDLRISYSNFKKKYSIHWKGMFDFKNCSNDTRQQLKKQLIEPKQIGVLTKKKIQEWADYYYNLYQLLAVEDAKNADKKDQFLKSIEGLPVKWHNNNTQGYIEKNGIEFSFTIGETYISTQVKLVAFCSTLEAFKQLSDNKFVKVN